MKYTCYLIILSSISFASKITDSCNDRISELFPKLISNNHSVYKIDKKDKKNIQNSVKQKFFRNEVDNSISYDTHLINATYYVDFKINRAELHKTLGNKYGITKNQCDYRPNAYPAVPIKFYWNEDNRFNGKFGKCTCTKTCNGKGIGKGNHG